MEHIIYMKLYYFSFNCSLHSGIIISTLFMIIFIITTKITFINTMSIKYKALQKKIYIYGIHINVYNMVFLQQRKLELSDKI